MILYAAEIILFFLKEKREKKSMYCFIRCNCFFLFKGFPKSPVTKNLFCQAQNSTQVLQNPKIFLLLSIVKYTQQLYMIQRCILPVYFFLSPQQEKWHRFIFTSGVTNKDEKSEFGEHHEPYGLWGEAALRCQTLRWFNTSWNCFFRYSCFNPSAISICPGHGSGSTALMHPACPTHHSEKVHPHPSPLRILLVLHQS